MLRGRFALAAVLAVAACDRLPASQDAPAPTPAPAAAEAEGGLAATPLALSASPTESASSYRTQQAVLIPEPDRAEKPRQAGIHTPPPGSTDRVALMNALRAVVRNDLGGDVVFVVQDLRSNGEWAFAVLEPTWTDGRRIRLETTPLYRRGDADELDGLRTEAIWRKQNGRWRVFAHNIGATDVWWLEHCGQTPRGLMPGC